MRTTAPYINQVPTISDVSLDVEDLELTQGPLPYLVDAKDYSEEYRTVSSLYFNVKLNDEFSMRTTLGIDYRNKSRQAWNGVTTSLGKTLGGQASYGTLEGLTYNIDHMFNYNKKINKHSFNGLAGVTLVSSNNFNYVISTTQFQGNVLAREEGIMYGTVIDIPTYSKSFFNTLSFLGRLVYSYDNRYILTTTFRADGSSKFEDNNKFSYFPSMALAYRLDQESFIKKLEAISNLKIRLGWGLVGNQSIAAFSTLQGYSGSRLSEPDGSSSLAIYPSNLPNKDLKWESSSQYNAGIDFGMFNNRVVLTVDAYHKMSKDLLQTINISQSAGFSTMSINRGSIRNQGVEISLDVTPIRTKDFSITLNGNISRNDNKIIDIGLEEGTFGAHTFKAYSGGGIGTSGTTSLTLMMIEGYPVSQFFGYKTDGIVQVADFERDRQVRTANYLALNPSANPTTLTEAQLQSVKGTLPAITAAYQYTTNPLLLQPGDPKYVDMNGDGIIDSKDGTLLGSPLPDFIYGFGMTMRYKELSLMANFNGMSGNKIANADRTREENILAINNGNITKYAYDNMYRPSAPSNLVPRYNYFGAIGNFLDTYIEDGSFLRLSSLSLSYNHKLKKRNVISGFGLSITGRNLFCLTKYMGYDPEISSFANDPMRAGISWSSYPRSRSYIAGLTIDF
jgi:TonB-linked SusC/RagA family outer membrane protein